MQRQTIIKLLPLCVLLFELHTVSGDADTDNAISCTSPGTVIEGDSLVLTCTYNQDMEHERQGFYIIRRENEKDAVIVVICDWEDILDCNVKPAYNVTVRNKDVILTIPSTLPEHAGVYRCNTLPAYLTADVEECTLTVQERKEGSLDISCSKHGEKTAIMCSFPASLEFSNILLEKYDFSGITEPVKIMQCYRDTDNCELKHTGYWLSSSSKAYIKSKGVTLHGNDDSKSGLYVCKTDGDRGFHAMCTITLDDGAPKLKEEEESLMLLTAPMYAILGCLGLALIIFLIAFVLKQLRLRRSNATSQTASSESRADEETAQMMSATDLTAAGTTPLANGHEHERGTLRMR